LTNWNDEKGFGFVTPRSGGNQVFIHITAFSNRKRRPELNELVTYTLSADKHGRPCAVNATLPGDRLPKKTKRKHASLSPVGAALFLAIVGISVLTAKIPAFIFALYMVASILTFIMYAVDKSSAQKGSRRTQESTLHLLSMAGGWPGALVAQQKLHHKSRKQSFRIVFWFTVLLNCGTFVWLFTPTGASALQSLIDMVA